MKFAVSNIQLRDGEITIDDQLLGKQHKIEKIQINVPFIANLPSDVDVFVQPLLQMVIDGSPLRIAGVAKPFTATRDSVVDLKLHRLDLPLYVSYAPMKLPVKIPSGTLSTDVYVHFVQAEAQPLIRLNGTVALDQLDVRDTADAPARRAQARRGEADRRRAARRGVLSAIDLDRRTAGECPAECRRHQQSLVVGER